MFRKPAKVIEAPAEVIEAPAAVKEELLAWLKGQLNPRPVASELTVEEPEEADEFEAINSLSNKMDVDESSEDEQKTETGSLEEFEPATKKVYRGHR